MLNWKKYIVNILLVVILIILPIINSTIFYKEINFITISRGVFYHYSQNDINYFDYSRYVIINSTDQWREIWDGIPSMYKNSDELPVYNLTTHTIIVVYQGLCPSSGYRIEIKHIIDRLFFAEILIHEESPEPNEIVFCVVTLPFHIVVTPKINKEITFTIG